jgi:hypothetical protein
MPDAERYRFTPGEVVERAEPSGELALAAVRSQC